MTASAGVFVEGIRSDDDADRRDKRVGDKGDVAMEGGGGLRGGRGK